MANIIKLRLAGAHVVEALIEVAYSAKAGEKMLHDIHNGVPVTPEDVERMAERIDEAVEALYGVVK